MTRNLLVLICCVSLCCSCQEKKERNIQLAVTDTTIFSFGKQFIIENQAISEASGMAASRVNQGKLWIHNDSGGDDFIFITDTLGKTLGKVQLLDTENRDWEDMAIVGNAQHAWVYIADTGDNLKWHSQKYIYRFAEPLLPDKSPFTYTVRQVEKYTFELPDGARDIECLFVDPHSLDIYLVSNREPRKEIYRLPYPQSTTQVQTAMLMGYLRVSQELPTDTKKNKQRLYLTSGDISPDGQEILLKNYSNIFYWKRKPQESIVQVLQRMPQVLPYKPEPQGEAIAFAADGQSYFTSSERTYEEQPTFLVRYRRVTKKSLSKAE